MHEELLRLYEEDQADRKGQMHPDMRERDRVRRQRIEELISAGALQTGEDYFHAAMIFQHGEMLAHYWRAHELAKKAAEMDHSTGRWLTAAAYDRWLMKQGKPQKYGTQYISHGGGPYTLWEVDPTTTDAERAEWNVPSLAEAQRRAEQITQSRTLRKEE
ncbi:MAG: hypothetical protein JOZ18_03935 [Chloroflexi bacterium]|nr:hypothetical protein [Chloroflexota bacterium]